MHFEWSEDKALKKQQKHNVNFNEALPCFYDPMQVSFYDPDHSDDEDREILLAHSNQGHLLLVVFTLKDNVIRIISARKSTKRETAKATKGQVLI